MKRGQWWDGRRWRARDDIPGNQAEAKAYKTAFDVLDEAVQAMIKDGPVNGLCGGAPQVDSRKAR